MSEMLKYLTDAGMDNDALTSAVGVLRTKQAMPHASTQSILWDAIKDYSERAEERTRSHASLVEENEILKLKLQSAIDDAEHWAGKWGMDTIKLEEENKRMREALELIANGYMREIKDFRFVIMDNPNFIEDDGSDPFVVWDTGDTNA